MLNLGVAREIITPKIGCQLYGYRPDLLSESVEDDLTATAFYFRSGDTQSLMISVAVCLVHTKLANRILDLIEEKYNIPKSNCILSATHTHSGPNVGGAAGWGDIDKDYTENIFIPGICLAVENAIKNTEPVKMGIGKGISLIGINRRELTPENKITFGQNPHGCFNPVMTIVSFKNYDGKTVGNMVYYGIHGTCAGSNTEITRDWSGVMIDTLDAVSGGITAFFNGPEGDVGPRLTNGRTTGNLRSVYELGHIAANDAVKIFNDISDYHDAELKAGTNPVEVPLKNKLPFEKAKEMYEEFKNDTVNWRGMMRCHLEDVMAAYENNIPDEDNMLVNQAVVSIGNAIFVTTPFELFSEIGLRIDADFPDASVLTLSNSNGSEAYFVTEDALCRGGYEVDLFLYGHVQQYVDNADWHFYKSSVENIKKVIN